MFWKYPKVYPVDVYYGDESNWDIFEELHDWLIAEFGRPGSIPEKRWLFRQPKCYSNARWNSCEYPAECKHVFKFRDPADAVMFKMIWPSLVNV